MALNTLVYPELNKKYYYLNIIFSTSGTLFSFIIFHIAPC